MLNLYHLQNHTKANSLYATREFRHHYIKSAIETSILFDVWISENKSTHNRIIYLFLFQKIFYIILCSR